MIPLIIEEERLRAAEAAAGTAPLLKLLPYVKKTAAIVATGSEVKNGLIQIPSPRWYGTSWPPTALRPFPSSTPGTGLTTWQTPLPRPGRRAPTSFSAPAA